MLDLSQLTEQTRAMGREAAARRRQYADLVALARRWLTQFADQGERLRHSARHVHAAIPTSEPLDSIHPLPPTPARFTVIAADGSQIQPDRHGAALYYLINVGSLVYRHGSGDAPEAHSHPILGYTEDDLYESGILVSGNQLDVRRDLAEITRLASLCVAERRDSSSSRRIVALVDGTLLLWVLEERANQERHIKVRTYLDQLDRIRGADAAVAALISRPRRAEVTRLLYLASAGGDLKRVNQEPNPVERLPDRAVFEALLPSGARSALFVSPSPVNHEYYSSERHTVHFFYVNLAQEGHDPIIARVELPAWVVDDPDLLALVHGAIVVQAHIAGGYPYALARADELAFVSRRERAAFEDLVVTALLREGLVTAPSPKAYYKNLTRRGRKAYR